MQTLILNEPGQFAHRATARPEAPGPGEVLVKVHRVGLCGTDIHAYGGNQPFFTYPRILGHELGVEVAAVGDGVDHLKPGDHAAVEPYLYCGKCPACQRGRTNCCRELQCLGVHCDGGMREEIILPATHLHPSATLPLEQLALVETLCIGRHAVERAQPEPGAPVAVIGLGPIGLTVLAFAQLRGAQVIGVDRAEGRAAKARELFGIETVVPTGDTTAAEAWSAAGHEPPLYLFDATGHPGSMAHTFSFADNGAVITFVGLCQADIAFHDPELHRKELTLLASRNATRHDFRAVLDALEQKQIDLKPWITHEVPAAQFPETIGAWLAPDSGLLKGIIRFS